MAATSASFPFMYTPFRASFESCRRRWPSPPRPKWCVPPSPPLPASRRLTRRGRRRLRLSLDIFFGLEIRKVLSYFLLWIHAIRQRQDKDESLCKGGRAEWQDLAA